MDIDDPNVENESKASVKKQNKLLLSSKAMGFSWIKSSLCVKSGNNLSPFQILAISVQ